MSKSDKKLPDDFDAHAYLAINPDVALAGMNPIEHYILYGRSEKRRYKFPAIDKILPTTDFVQEVNAIGSNNVTSSDRHPSSPYVADCAPNSLYCTGTESQRSKENATSLANKIKLIGSNSTSFLHFEDIHYVDRNSISDIDSQLIRMSGMFDEEYYGGSEEAQKLGVDPINHYVNIGEMNGLDPSRRFSAAGYRLLNPDVAESGSNALLHYLRFGKSEGRATAITDAIDFPCDSKRKAHSVVIAFHECSRTGAPILGWNIARVLRNDYNIISLIKIGGAIEAEILDVSDVAIVLPENAQLNPEQCTIIAGRLNELYRPAYLIANSVETRCFVPSFEALGIPSISLIHEFADYEWIPSGSLSDLLERSSRLIFSSRLVAENMMQHYPSLSLRDFDIIAQGRSILPYINERSRSSEPSLNSLEAIFGDNRNGDLFIVLGLGRITPRKGVDIFVSTAAELLRCCPTTNIRFIWIGGSDSLDLDYRNDVVNLIQAHGLNDHLKILPEVGDLSHIYSQADLLFLSSRLDPFPNVAIDAACEGIPIVCFAGRSGIAELLANIPTLQNLVVPYADTRSTSCAILNAASASSNFFNQSDLQKLAKTFDMEEYVKRIDKLGTKPNANSIKLKSVSSSEIVK